MKNINLATVAIGIAVGFIAYKVIKGKKTTETTSSFSSACGCGA
tara:strand:- start:480 stop:611 length:132 start_codon:yes stop_codon:yes gene_type:complete